ncbi:MAG: DUF1933 domain-containing protein [Proteobacteria bacterium]|nr:DUF1933 domain-containing protein [Pseudomonadota bacterium]
MIYSFFMTNKRKNIDSKTNLNRYYPLHLWKQFIINSYQVNIRTECIGEFDQYFAKLKKQALIVIGEIYNISALKKMMLPLERDVMLYSPAQVVLLLLSAFGEHALSLLEGCYTLVYFKQPNEVFVYTDLFSQMPCYYTKDSDDNIWITTEIKNLIGIEGIDLCLNSLRESKFFLNNPDKSNIFKNIKRIPSGMCLSISSLPDAQIKLHSYHNFYSKKPLFLSEEQATQIFEELFNQSIMDAIGNQTEISIPLSGGLDSSLVAALANKKVKKLWTVSIGREDANEFSFAQDVSKLLGSHHLEIFMELPSFIQALVHSVFYNEIYDGVCGEIHAPFYLMYKKISELGKTVLTGYGADMLFAGHATPSVDLSSLYERLWKGFQRVQWRGEFRPFVAQKWGIDVRHPFCSNKMIAFSLHLDPNLKIAKNHVKYLLRNFAMEKNYLPENICWREKIAIERASSIHKMFSDYLGISSNFGYEKKDQFMYSLFEKIFVHHVPIEDLDSPKTLKKLVNY